MSTIIKAQENDFGKSVIVLLGMDHKPVSHTIFSNIEQSISKKYAITVITNNTFYDDRIQHTLKKLCLPFENVSMTELLKSFLPQEVFENLPALVLYDRNQRQYVVEPIRGNKKGYFFRKAIEAIEEYIKSSKCANDFDIVKYTEGWSDYSISQEVDSIRHKSQPVCCFFTKDMIRDMTRLQTVDKGEDVGSENNGDHKEDSQRFTLTEKSKKNLLNIIEKNGRSKEAVNAMIDYLQQLLEQTPQHVCLVVCKDGNLRFRRENGSLTDYAHITTKELAIYHFFLRHPEGVELSRLEDGEYKSDFKEIFLQFGDYRSSYYDTMVAKSCSGLRSNIANIKGKMQAIGGVYAHPDFTITAKEKSVYYIKTACTDRIEYFYDQDCIIG